MTNQEFIESIALEGEEWRDVVGYEGKYWISSFGRTLSYQPSLKNPFRIRKPQKDKLGYYKLSLYKDSKQSPRWIHRLVAQAFLPNPMKLNEIDHIDGNPSNNIASNLRWVTHRENMNNPISLNRHKSMKGIPNVKLNKKVVLLPLENEGITIFESAKSTNTLGYNPKNVAQVCNGSKKTHQGRCFMWLSDYEAQVSMSKNS